MKMLNSKIQRVLLYASLSALVSFPIGHYLGIRRGLSEMKQGIERSLRNEERVLYERSQPLINDTVEWSSLSVSRNHYRFARDYIERHSVQELVDN